MSAATKEHQFTAISLFTGAGGLDIGFEQAGFKTLSAVEINPVFVNTIITNQRQNIVIPNLNRTYFGSSSIFNSDIRDLSGKTLNPTGQDIDCIIGGPPCQAFSSAGKQESVFDERGTLIYEYLRMLDEIRPKTFLFENVRGLATAKGKNAEPGEVLLGLTELFLKLGYNCRVELLNSADYGSFQRRVRCFIIGSRIGIAPQFPTPTHSSRPQTANLFEPAKSPWRTLGDFLSLYQDNDQNNWTRPSPHLLEELASLPDGCGLKSVGRKEATRPSGHWGYRQGTFIADQSKPARTVTGSSSQDWIRLPDSSLRRLTIKEVARLQGFPEEWIFCGNRSEQFKQVGNAVPTVFGNVIGHILREYLQGGYSTQSYKAGVEISDSIHRSIKYTKYDNERNGSFRVNRLAKVI